MDYKLTQKTLRSAPDGIPYAELAEYETIWSGGLAQESKRLLLCKWTDRYNLPLDMLPRVGVVPIPIEPVTVSKFASPTTDTATRLQLNRFDPEPHPVYPNLFALYAREVKGEGSPTLDPVKGNLSFSGTPAPSQVAGSGLAQVEILYKRLPYPIGQYADSVVNDVTPGGYPGAPGTRRPFECCRYVQVKPKGSAKNLPMQAGGSVFWEVYQRTINGQLQRRQMINDPGVVQLSQVHLAYTWYMVPFIPDTALSMMGCTNAYVFDAFRRNVPWDANSYPIGTVLYLYPDIDDLYYLIDGTPVVDITYHFIYSPNGWNAIYLPTAGGFVPVYRGATIVVTPPATVGIFPQQPLTVPVAINGVGPANPPSGDPFNRFGPGYNVYDYADLNLLFANLA